jgi:hypothetical protein
MGEPEFRDGVWWFRRPDGSLLRWDTATNSWVAASPQGAGPEAPVPAAWKDVAEPWQPLRTRAKAVRILLWATVAASVIAAISDAAELDLLGRIDAGQLVSDSEIHTNDTRQGVIGLVQGALFLGTAVAFIMWFSRAYENIGRLGAGPLRYRKGWAIGAWFVPILNLFRPKQIANDIWRGSDPDMGRLPDASDWRDGPIPGLLFGLWWLLWLATNLSLGPGFFEADTPDEFRSQTIRFLISDVTGALGAILCAVVVDRTTHRQEERARRVADASAGEPATAPA